MAAVSRLVNGLLQKDPDKRPTVTDVLAEEVVQSTLHNLRDSLRQNGSEFLFLCLVVSAPLFFPSEFSRIAQALGSTHPSARVACVPLMSLSQPR